MTTALITGASSGIGEEFAKQLAAKKTDLILVARSRDKLEALASKLQQQYLINTEVIVQDLTEPAAGKTVFESIQQVGLTVDLLINNAGFGDYGDFSDRDLSKQLAMIQLNVMVLTELTGLFLPVMKQRGYGTIINLSSIAGFQPLPYMSVYAATKAFVLSFTEALWAENKDSGVRILAVCPGPTKSDFFNRADFPDSLPEIQKNLMTPTEDVVADALKALDKKRSNIVTGGLPNQFIANLPRFLPRALLVDGVEKQFKP
jgi:short-subunit dehydrogenase